MLKKYLYARPWFTVFEGDGGDGGDGGGDGGDGGGDGGDGGGDGGDGKSADKTFTQDQVNKFLAEEKRKGQVSTQKALSELEALKKRSNLNSEERKELDGRIEQLQNAILTKDELAKKEKDKVSTEHKTKIDEMTTDRDMWKGKYTGSTINRDITDASVDNNAFSPKQIVALLRPDTQLVEDLDAEGKPTGELVPKVTFKTKDDDDKPVTLTLTIPEAVKRMSEMDEYGNLFHTDGTGGIGSRSKPGKGGSDKDDAAELAKTDPVKYRQLRKEGKITVEQL